MFDDYDTPSKLLAATDPTLPPSPHPIVLDKNPATGPYPVGLSLDVALRSAPLPEILEAYGLTPEQYHLITQNPAYQRELEEHNESLKVEGWSFRKKAQAQAEAYLDLVFGLVNSNTTPVQVKADLIRSTVKWAGLEAPPPPKQAQDTQADLTALADELKNMSEGELEMRVMQIVSKRTTTQTTAPDGTQTTTTTTTAAAQVQAAPANTPHTSTQHNTTNSTRIKTPFGDAVVVKSSANTYDSDLDK